MAAVVLDSFSGQASPFGIGLDSLIAIVHPRRTTDQRRTRDNVPRHARQSINVKFLRSMARFVISPPVPPFPSHQVDFFLLFSGCPSLFFRPSHVLSNLFSDEIIRLSWRRYERLMEKSIPSCDSFDRLDLIKWASS